MIGTINAGASGNAPVILNGTGGARGKVGGRDEGAASHKLDNHIAIHGNLLHAL